MRQAAIAAVLVFLTVSSGPPTTKWVGPTVAMPGGGHVQTTIYYGPWQCRAVWLNACHQRCGGAGRRSMGCIWLADVKTDLRTRFLFMPISWGGRLAITHCCCDWPESTPNKNARDVWERGRDGYRGDWTKEFGEWPKDGERSWPGHHIHDLLHGGDPLSRDNILPTPPQTHKLYNDAYPACYAGGGRWAQPGPEIPYVD